MQTVLIVFHLMIVIALVATVLLQRSEGGALGVGGGGGFMTGRGSANLLTRVTAGLAACFMATSLVLAILVGGPQAPTSILDTPGTMTEEPAEAQPLQEPTPSDTAPSEPAEPQSQDPTVPLGQ